MAEFNSFFYPAVPKTLFSVLFGGRPRLFVAAEQGR